ncbi:MAG: sigma-70 family RNA polymerase sigma factor [Pedobacter sp.]|nr:sigma-70 family RNA polymerase sigma factor [Pedobacter sp.]MDQ8052543.1 sigma-70 family RNA polymerase sigma factor [Pedobacter sp.]
MMRLFPLELLLACKKGDASAQRKLFDFYYDEMYQVCYRYVKDEMLVEDLLSQGFTKVLNKIGKFRAEKENGLRAWIKTIMINECLMQLRRRNNFYLVPLSDADELSTEEVDFDEIDQSFVRQCIAELPTGYRTVLNLYVIEGYAHAEIGKMLDIKEATSRSQLNKAKQILKQRLLSYKLSLYGKG